MNRSYRDGVLMAAERIAIKMAHKKWSAPEEQRELITKLYEVRVDRS